jgi:small subunit ribosomal protein S16
MAVSIRLRRMGRKKQPHYRIVVAESEHPRDGRFVESLGFYKPLSRPARLVVDLARVDHWIGQGAQPSDTVRTLIKKARQGGDESVAVGDVDVQVARAKRSEMLAERRTAERKKAQAPAPTVVPQDVAERTGGSSSEDATAAEAMAEGEAVAVADAEDSEPNAPPQDSIAKAASVRGGKKKGKPPEGGA